MASYHRAELVFPLHPQHNHAPGIVQCPNGDLLVSWYRGSGERQADDVAVYFGEAAARDGVTGKTYELGGPDAVTWNELWARLKRVLGQRRPSIHVPMAVMRANALVTERLPGNIPLTRDLLKMLEHGDNVVSNDEAVRTFQVSLVPLDDQLRRAL